MFLGKCDICHWLLLYMSNTHPFIELKKILYNNWLIKRLGKSKYFVMELRSIDRRYNIVLLSEHTYTCLLSHDVLYRPWEPPTLTHKVKIQIMCKNCNHLWIVHIHIQACTVCFVDWNGILYVRPQISYSL